MSLAVKWRHVWEVKRLNLKIAGWGPCSRLNARVDWNFSSGARDCLLKRRGPMKRGMPGSVLRDGSLTLLETLRLTQTSANELVLSQAPPARALHAGFGSDP